MKPFRLVLAAALAIAFSSAQAGGMNFTLDFETFPDGTNVPGGQSDCSGATECDIVHGHVIDTQFEDSHWVTISVENFRNTIDGNTSHPNIGVAFDSNLEGTRDGDLQVTDYGTNTLGWDGGNLPANPNPSLGNMLIIQENDSGCSDGLCDYPDDEGRRPAGIITMEWLHDDEISELGFDLIDVEGPEGPDDDDYFALFFSDGNPVGMKGFNEFIVSDGVVYGDNFANTVGKFSIGSTFDKVEFHFGGSAAIDNIKWTKVTNGTASEPGMIALLGIGLAGLTVRRRRRDTS